MARAFKSAWKRSGSPTDTVTNPEPWHAIEIRLGREPCEAACAVSGRRFLAADAPFLPLKECDRSGRCDCRYRHYDDRRAGPRRAADGGPPKSAAGDRAERRSAQGRRKEDQPNWVEPNDDEPPSILDDTYYEYVSRLKRSD